MDFTPQDFSQQHVNILPVALRIAGTAAVSKRNVQVSRLVESQPAPIVVGEWLVQGQQNVFCGGIREIGVRWGGGKLSDRTLQLATGVARVVHEKATVL